MQIAFHSGGQRSGGLERGGWAAFGGKRLFIGGKRVRVSAVRRHPFGQRFSAAKVIGGRGFPKQHIDVFRRDSGDLSQRFGDGMGQGLLAAMLPPRAEVHGLAPPRPPRAGCRDPRPGEERVGYITRGRGVSVHAANCPNVEKLLYGSERRIDVSWSRARGEKTTRPVKIRVIMDDHPGVLARITTAISEEEINIRTVDARVDEEQRGMVLLVLDIEDTRHLQRILKRLRGIEGIRQAERSQGA